MRSALSNAARLRHRRRPWLTLLVGLALLVGPAASRHAQADGLDFARNDNTPRAEKTRETLTHVIEAMQRMDADLVGADRIAALAEARTQVDQLTDGELEEIDEAIGPQLQQMSAAIDALRAIDPGGEDRSLMTDPGFPGAAYPLVDTSIATSDGTNVQTGSCERREGQCLAPIAITCTTSADCGGDPCIDGACNQVHGVCHGDPDCAVGTCVGGDRCTGDFGNQSEANNIQMSLSWNCDRFDRSTVEQAYGALTAFITAEAVKDVASRICNFDFGVFVAGGNFSVVCIVVDVAFLTAKSLYTNLDLCDRFINSAEISATYARLEHVHVDIEQHDANIKGDVSAATTAVNARTASAEALLQQEISTHDTDVDAQLVLHDADIAADVTQHDADIKAALAASRAFKLRLEIEEALFRDERDAIYYLPEPAGNLGLARQIVSETMARVDASEESVNYAQRYLNTADSEIGRGEFKRAFSFLSRAYFEAVKINGERR